MKNQTGFNYQKLYFIAFILAIGLRLGVATFNLQANDDHLTVIRIIVKESRLPEDQEAWEAFQPKLYHLTVALLIKGLPFLNGSYNVKIAQFVNALAGVLTVYTIFRSLQQFPFSERTKFWSFALIALNPQFIGINGQATNDSFIILFFTLSLYYAVQFFRQYHLKGLLLLTVFSILAGLSKGNAILIIPIFLGAWLVEMVWRIWKKPPTAPRIFWVAPAIFLLVYLAIVPYFGQYIEKYQRYGTPFETNMPEQPLPKLFEKTYYARPGVTSIADSYFTFHYLDLLTVPINLTRRAYDYPIQRTSLWTQLFALTYFVHYDQYPPTWRTQNRFILYVGRFIYMLALIPALLGLWGLIKNAATLLKPASAEPVALPERWLYLLSVGGFLAFIILYTMRIRDYSTMKAIFLYPATLGFTYILADGMESFWKKAQPPVIQILVEGALAALVILGCIDVLFLIGQLAGILPSVG